MSLFGFGKRSRKRRSRRVSRKGRSSRRSRRGSRRRGSRRRSRRNSGIERIGNKVKVAGRGGKIKSLKVKKDKEGREYYVSGKRKTKHFLEGKKRRRSTRRRRSARRNFGYMKNGLINMMGNFRPSAQMSLAQSTTGMSAPQMIGHMNGIPPSLRSNFYTNIL